MVTDFGGKDFAFGVALQADGKLVAAGGSTAGARSPNLALARYDAGGNLDPTFNNDGKVVTGFGGRGDEYAHDVAIQADRKIVAAGEERGGANAPNFALARYNLDGRLDSSFGGDGRVVTDFVGGEFAGSDVAEGVAIQADGKIVAAGTTSSGDDPGNFALARYLPDGVVNQPPDCSAVAASPNTLRPPDHRLRLVTLSGAADPDGDTVTLTVTAVTQDEPLNGLGDGDRSPDARATTSTDSVFLRAERSGGGDGRVYRVSFTGSDGKGGSCSGTVTVGVPRSATSIPIDSAPPSFDSFGS